MKGTLKKQKDFSRVFGRGKKLSNNFLSIFFRSNKECENRTGFVVSSKIKSAVQRNRIKRLLRESYRLIKKDFRSGIDIIVLGKETLIDKKLAVAKEALEEIVKRMVDGPKQVKYGL